MATVDDLGFLLGRGVPPARDAAHRAQQAHAQLLQRLLAHAPHPVHVHVGHWDGWMVHIAAEGTDLVYWMVHVSDSQLSRLVSHLRISPSEREQYPQALPIWGRTSSHAYLTRRQARIFTWAAFRAQRHRA